MAIYFNILTLSNKYTNKNYYLLLKKRLVGKYKKNRLNIKYEFHFFHACKKLIEIVLPQISLHIHISFFIHMHNLILVHYIFP